MEEEIERLKSRPEADPALLPVVAAVEHETLVTAEPEVITVTKEVVVGKPDKLIELLFLKHLLVEFL